MTRVLITGVAGFIGAHTLEHFLTNTNWSIVGIDSLEHRGNYARVNQVLAKNPELWAQRFHFIKKDLTKPLTVLELEQIDKVDYVLNLAAESHVDRSITDPVPFVKNNFDLMVNMLEYARFSKPKAFIQISTDEVYGPMTNNLSYREWDRLLPSNPYSASKAAQEVLAISYWRTYGVPLVITNTMNNIGEMQDSEKFLPLLINKILDGKVVKIHGSREDMGSRFYLHARNHADALLFILNNLPPSLYSPGVEYPDRYNIVGTQQVGNLELARIVANRLGKELKYTYDSSVRPGHDLHYGLKGGKLEGLGWHPPVSFDDGLERTISNYLTHKEWLK